MSSYVTEIEPTSKVLSDPMRSASGAGYSEQALDLERPLGAARGIVNAALISIPIWVLFVFALYLLI